MRGFVPVTHNIFGLIVDLYKDIACDAIVSFACEEWSS
jgi:hypothetical protein